MSRDGGGGEGGGGRGGGGIEWCMNGREMETTQMNERTDGRADGEAE
jgi:hypothetical protein